MESVDHKPSSGKPSIRKQIQPNRMVYVEKMVAGPDTFFFSSSSQRIDLDSALESPCPIIEYRNLRSLSSAGRK